MTDAPTRLVLIRHGESRSNAEGWISGNATCGGLTDLGRAQAAALRDRLAADAHLAPDAIYSSTMSRAVETAQIVAEPTELMVEQMAELSDRAPGECEGMTTDEYRTHYGRAPWSTWQEPISPGGETSTEFFERVRQVVSTIAEQMAGRTVWIVCHGGVIIVASRLLMAAPADDDALRWANPANSALAEWLRFDGQPWRLGRYNDHTHLLTMDDQLQS